MADTYHKYINELLNSLAKFPEGYEGWARERERERGKSYCQMMLSQAISVRQKDGW